MEYNIFAHLLKQSISIISLPFIVYIAFQIGKIIQTIKELSRRTDNLEHSCNIRHKGD